jgi:hypothetical protein
MPPLPQPMNHFGRDIRGNVVTLHDPSRCGDAGGFPHTPDLAEVWLVSVHAGGESEARVGVAVLGGLRIHCIVCRLLRVTPRPKAWQIMLASLRVAICINNRRSEMCR